MIDICYNANVRGFEKGINIGQIKINDYEQIVVVDNGNVPSHILDMAKQKGIEICVEKDYIGRPEITEAMVIPLNQSYIPDYSYLSETHTGHGKGRSNKKKNK